MSRNRIAQVLHESATIRRLSEIRSLTTCENLEAELMQHIHLENNILFARATASA